MRNTVEHTGQRVPSDVQGTEVFGVTSDPVADYFKRIRESPLLTREEEVELAKRIEAGVLAKEVLDNPNRAAAYQLESVDGDLAFGLRTELVTLTKEGQEAKEIFVIANLRLVVSIAKSYEGRGLPLLDLIQEGNIGLMHAVEMFDHKRGFKFSTYATQWIVQSIGRAVDNTAKIIRKPVAVARFMRTIDTSASGLMGQGLDPGEVVAELAKRFDTDANKINELLRDGKDPLSLSTPLVNGGDTELGDLIPDRQPRQEEVVVYSAMDDAVRDALSTLPKLEAEILSLHFGLNTGEPMTYDGIAALLGLNPDVVGRLARVAIAKLLHPSRRHLIEDFAPVGGLGDSAESPLCAQVDPEIFFPGKGGGVNLAKAVCGRCLVLTECREDAINNNSGKKYGVWGGLSTHEREIINNE